MALVLGTFLLLDTRHFVLILLSNLIPFVLIVLGYLISRDKGVIYLVENTLGYLQYWVLFLLLGTCHFVLIVLGSLISRDKGVIYLVENTLG